MKNRYWCFVAILCLFFVSCVSAFQGKGYGMQPVPKRGVPIVNPEALIPPPSPTPLSKRPNNMNQPSRPTRFEPQRPH